MKLDFGTLFPVSKPVIGMIHLAGKNRGQRVANALLEMEIYQEAGVSGAIIEDYHGTEGDVVEALRQSQAEKFTIVRGVNLLRDPYKGFDRAHQYGAQFVQFDNVQTRDLNLKQYDICRSWWPSIHVLGGVRFKGTRDTGNPLRQDLEEAVARCEAIVTTGEGTGIETPLDKLREFRSYLGFQPLIVGAGVTAENVHDQLSVADAAIVGSYFKPQGNTERFVDRGRVRSLMDVVRRLREE